MAYQVFYEHPYNPSTILTIIIVFNIFFVLVYHELGPTDSVICSRLIPLASSIDLHRKRVVGGADDGEYGGEVREVTVKRPLVGFMKAEKRLESPEGAGGVWSDGFLYEEAIIRIH
ncbi:hypothetical protein SI65_02443 [Aspergillus cristatus]|uniref:Uncharacterized protein n=1 Tax=Aspergillus cristatus TaxID=573508 RepID=A0A1E3BKX6_ASPCR|nr:hypothetical protein SI65_02443 [Aspergillus cristatus]